MTKMKIKHTEIEKLAVLGDLATKFARYCREHGVTIDEASPLFIGYAKRIYNR